MQCLRGVYFLFFCNALSSQVLQACLFARLVAREREESLYKRHMIPSAGELQGGTPVPAGRAQRRLHSAPLRRVEARSHHRRAQKIRSLRASWLPGFGASGDSRRRVRLASLSSLFLIPFPLFFRALSPPSSQPSFLEELPSSADAFRVRLDENKDLLLLGAPANARASLTSVCLCFLSLSKGPRGEGEEGAMMEEHGGEDAFRCLFPRWCVPVCAASS